MNFPDEVPEEVRATLTQLFGEWGIAELTDVQVSAIKAGVASGESMIVSAPTSSGKTLIGEVALYSSIKRGISSLYLVSHRALADQKYKEFLKKFGDEARDPIASIALETGDRTEGDIDSQVVVSTYEKALALLLSGRLFLNDCCVVTDELQILGDHSRGPTIETLCAMFHQRGLKQFVALTATIENPQDIAKWMGCKLVQSSIRSIPLQQEIWYGEHAISTVFGESESYPLEQSVPKSSMILDVVQNILERDRGPVLVFTETRGEATSFARAYSERRPRFGDGTIVAKQLELFTEPTEASTQLAESAEKRVAYHTADLSSQERQVVEEGFINGRFDVCFATPTLAAGVNFPFKTVVFPKLTYQFRSEKLISRSDYRNMSGRAGRLGMHERGFSVLLPQSPSELTHAKNLVLPENDPVKSNYFDISLRKSILDLIAFRLVSTYDDLEHFYTNTLYWMQVCVSNPSKKDHLLSMAKTAISWLNENGLILIDNGQYQLTELGKGASLSGLLPSTTVSFAKLFQRFSKELESDFEAYQVGLLYCVCACDEFSSDTPSRFLPFPQRGVTNSHAFLISQKMMISVDPSENRLAQSAHAMALHILGESERKISYQTKLSAGNVNRLALDVAWVLEGIHKISVLPTIGCSQNVSNHILQLSRMVRWGVPIEALDIIRIANRHEVPGFGRQRVMTLIANGISSCEKITGMDFTKLAKMIGSEERAKKLIEAVSSSISGMTSGLRHAHSRLAQSLDIMSIVDSCYKDNNVEYEDAIFKLLRLEPTWIVTHLDDGVTQNVPDLQISLGELHVLIECKTCTRNPPHVKKEDAWAVLQKAADFDSSVHRVTLGKPDFDETAKKKAANAHDITLVEHSVFMEGMLRVLSGSLRPLDFLNWLTVKGLSELDRLGGVPSYLS